jgi:hypothetical protein
MTPTRYRECSDRLTRAWATGAVTVPGSIGEWLEAWVQHRIEHPDPLPPTDWRRR